MIRAPRCWLSLSAKQRNTNGGQKTMMEVKPMRIPQTSLRQLCWFAVIFLVLAARPTPAQVTGVATIQGVVTDHSDAIVAGAEVTIINLETGVALKSATNDAGLYRLSGL